MFGKKIKVCKKCSGFDVTDLDALVGKKKYSVGCINCCNKDKNNFYGKINSHVIACDNKEDLFSQIKTAVN